MKITDYDDDYMYLFVVGSFDEYERQAIIGANDGERLINIFTVDKDPSPNRYGKATAIYHGEYIISIVENSNGEFGNEIILRNGYSDIISVHPINEEFSEDDIAFLKANFFKGQKEIIKSGRFVVKFD